MPRYIDADALYELAAELEASALAYIEKLNRKPLKEMDEDDRAEWHRWTVILGERSAFKHDVADSPTADVVEVVRCKDCKWWKTNFTWNCKEVKVCVKDPFEPSHKEEFFCADGERKSE